MELKTISSMEELISSLKNYVLLNKQSNLSQIEKELKNSFQQQMTTFLNDLDTVATHSSNRSKVPYSLEMVTEFIKGYCIPYLSDEEEAEIKKRQEKQVHFSNKLDELMKERGVRAKDVIESIGINQSLFSKIKNGYISPSDDLLKRLSTYFSYDLSEFKDL